MEEARLGQTQAEIVIVAGEIGEEKGEVLCGLERRSEWRGPRVGVADGWGEPKGVDTRTYEQRRGKRRDVGGSRRNWLVERSREGVGEREESI